MNYTRGVTLITCTGDRQKTFSLCARYVARQTYEGPLQWIVVDDGKFRSCSPEIDALRCRGWVVTRIYPEPMTGNSLARNMLVAIPEVLHDKVLFVEDDDWYAPHYAAVMSARLDHASFAGEERTNYYHVPSRQWRVMHNAGRSSLCQTGITAGVLPRLKHLCEMNSRYIDVHLWNTQGDHILLDTAMVVGMKGLPGRPGIGIGHHPDTHPREWSKDADLSVLRSWIGSDADLYREFI